MAYVADPTNAAQPADSADASGGAAELRALKGYLQTLLNNGSSIPVTGYAWQGFRNKLINGNFDIWQRGTSAASAVNNIYLADRWRTNGAGSTTVISRQAFTLGQTTVPYEPEFFHRVVVTSVAGAANFTKLSQRIEDVRTFAGRDVIIGFWAKADAAKNIAVEILQSFGTGGAPSADISAIGVTTKSLSTAFQFFTVTVSIPSISGKTLGTNNDDFLELNFWFEAGANFNARTNSLGQQSGTFDIAQVQMEAGTSTTPFELLPPDKILSACQRYCVTLGREGSGTLVLGGYCTGAIAFATFYAPVSLRDVPVWNGGTLRVVTAAGVVNASSILLAVTGNAIVVSANQVNTSGHSAYLESTATTGFRGFTAEL